MTVTVERGLAWALSIQEQVIAYFSQLRLGLGWAELSQHVPIASWTKMSGLPGSLILTYNKSVQSSLLAWQSVNLKKRFLSTY